MGVVSPDVKYQEGYFLTMALRSQMKRLFTEVTMQFHTLSFTKTQSLKLKKPGLPNM